MILLRGKIIRYATWFVSNLEIVPGLIIGIGVERVVYMGITHIRCALIRMHFLREHSTATSR